MRVQKIMNTKIETTYTDATLKEASKRMKSSNVGFLPVFENDRLVGTITDRDITIRAVAEGRLAEETRIREIMTSDVFYCFEDQTVEEVAGYMARREVRRMLIVNRDMKLTGVVSLPDIAKARGEQKLAGETLRGIARAA